MSQFSPYFWLKVCMACTLLILTFPVTILHGLRLRMLTSEVPILVSCKKSVNVSGLQFLWNHFLLTHNYFSVLFLFFLVFLNFFLNKAVIVLYTFFFRVLVLFPLCFLNMSYVLESVVSLTHPLFPEELNSIQAAKAFAHRGSGSVQEKVTVKPSNSTWNCSPSLTTCLRGVWFLPGLRCSVLSIKVILMFILHIMKSTHGMTDEVSLIQILKYKRGFVCAVVMHLGLIRYTVKSAKETPWPLFKGVKSSNGNNF